VATEPHTPPMAPSNEGDPGQLDVARVEGDAYGRALAAMGEESGAVVRRAGDYVVAFVQEDAEGMWAPDDTHGLVWREAPERANAHLEVAVADAVDGRFVPGLGVTLTLSAGARTLFTTRVPFLWHPLLHRYGLNVRVPGTGPYTATVRIDPPPSMRHDPVNGRRFGTAVDVVYADVPFALGRKPSPDAQPRGEDTPLVEG